MLIFDYVLALERGKLEEEGLRLSMEVDYVAGQMLYAGSTILWRAKLRLQEQATPFEAAVCI
jgi:hypothetical protein